MKRQRSAAIKHAFPVIRVLTSAFLRNTGDQKIWSCWILFFRRISDFRKLMKKRSRLHFMLMKPMPGGDFAVWSSCGLIPQSPFWFWKRLWLFGRTGQTCPSRHPLVLSPGAQHQHLWTIDPALWSLTTEIWRHLPPKPLRVFSKKQRKRNSYAFVFFFFKFNTTVAH